MVENEKKVEKENLPERGSDEAMLTRRGYQLDKKINEGSYGRVYLAYFKNQRNGNFVKLACKVMDANKKPEDFVQKFLPREIEALRRLRHQNLIKIHSMMERKNRYYIFLQYADKGDLLEFLKENGRLAEKQAKIWFSQIMKGVEFLHKSKYVHRDIKCDNILLMNDYVIKITDFGFARKMSNKSDLSITYCGSPNYTPPEIISATPYKPMPADIWSCGIVLFVMMNKSMPFDYKNKDQILELQNKKAYKFRRRVRDRVSLDLVELVAALIEPDPGKRPTASEVLKNKWFNEMPQTKAGLTSGTVVKKSFRKSEEIFLKESGPGLKKKKLSLKKTETAPVKIPASPAETIIPHPQIADQGPNKMQQSPTQSPAPTGRRRSEVPRHHRRKSTAPKKTHHRKSHPPQHQQQQEQPPAGALNRRNTKGAIMGGQHKEPPKPLPQPIEPQSPKKRKFSFKGGGERRKSKK